jgi:ABC-type nitrate/sulfonate/bicarbonate transport system permease component
MLIFFAVTGSWQLFNWHESSRDDQTYVAPRVLAILSTIHKDAHIPPTPGRRPTPLRYFMLAAAIGLIVSAVLGVIMAYRYSRQPRAATICLLGGILVPGVLLWIYK